MDNIKKLKVISFAKFQLIIFAIIGFVLGAFYSFGGFIYDYSSTGLNYGSMLAFLALIGMPIMFCVVGFFLGIIEALIYNLIVKWIPIIKIDFYK